MLLLKRDISDKKFIEDLELGAEAMVKLNKGDRAAHSVLCKFESIATVILEKYAKR